MAKEKKRYVCQECGYSSFQWLGKCPSCNAWNSFVEEVNVSKTSRHGGTIRVTPVSLSKIEMSETDRICSGIGEFDRVLGGGIVKGSLILVGGEPGIGKSTLLLQTSDELAKLGMKILYVSGEESAAQIKMRADRLGVKDEKIYLLSQTDIDEIIKEIDELNPNIIIVDSIQTLYDSEIGAMPGSVSQVRGCGMKLIEVAKGRGSRLAPTIFLIGHVTKEGMLAGPKTLEHMVDTVLYLEGDKNDFYRILRAAKNRYGSTNEIGVYEMNQNGLQEVKDPSFSFLGNREASSPGTVITCVMEGTRPFLIEIQALLSFAGYRLPQRVATGINYKRLAMLLAVVECRLGIKVGSKDVFINVIGGLQVEETASDLAVILAIASAVKNVAIPKETVIIGEVGLGGEVRPVRLLDKRLKEIEKLGFKKYIGPAIDRSGYKKKIEIIGVRNVKEVINEAFYHHSKL